MVYYNSVPQSCRLPVLQNSRSLQNNLQNQFRKLSDIRHLHQYRILLRLLPTSNVPVLSEQYKFLHNVLFLLHHPGLYNLSVSLSVAPFPTVHGNKWYLPEVHHTDNNLPDKKMPGFICMLILQCNLCFLFKRHWEIAVKSSAWHYCHRYRIYDAFSAKSTAEEVSKRTFYRWILFIIPVHTDNQIP